MASFGFVGGSFDPVHYGHLRTAIEFAQSFHLPYVSLLPCYQSPHRATPFATAAQRLTMLQLAVETSAMLRVDDRELAQQQLSYTVDTLQQLRQELGAQSCIYFAIGADAFAHIEQWKNYQQLFTYANIVVFHRPGYRIDIRSAFLQQRLTPIQQQNKITGALYELPVTALGISSTRIRELIQQQQALDYLLPANVAQFIQQQRLYQQ